VHPRAGLEERIGGRQLEWRRVESPRDAVDLKAGDDPETYVVAYAATEIDVPRATRALLGIGSDDGVKVWLNGKLVHERWAIRPVQPDEDVVPVQLVRGPNRLLLKVQTLRTAGVSPVASWARERRATSWQRQFATQIAMPWGIGSIWE